MGPAATVLTLAMALGTLFLAFPAVSHADVTAVHGSAYGYFTDVSLFGGPSEARGPEPTVALDSDASNSPQDASVASAQAVYGPAVLFRSGEITVHAEGTLGAGGSAATSARVQGDPDPEQRPGPFLFDAVDSSCTATEDGVTGEVEIMGGVLETSYDADTGEATTTEDVPVNPEPNHTREGTLDHVGDSYRIIFNERVDNADGSTTINAVRMELLGPTAVGELVIGSTTCGVTGESTTPPPATQCPVAAEPAPFADRDAIPEAHRANVDCAATMDVIRGFAEDNTYRARIQVRRDQMASFIARSLTRAGAELPPPAAERFSDVPAGSTHDDAIHRLAAAGIVLGGAGGGPADTYGPALRVRRDQMASFLIRAAEFATDQSLASQTQAFADVPPTNSHFENVNGAATIGLTQGFGDNTYRPGAVVRRDQMASFIVRLLNEISTGG